MATYNFHIRKTYFYLEGGGGPENAPEYWTTSGDFYINSVSYTNMDECFMLVPRISGSHNTTFFAGGAYSLYFFRVANVDYQFPTYPYKMNFADINSGLADTLRLRYQNAVILSDKNNAHISNSEWVTAGYTPGTFNTFKNEVTAQLATSLNGDRGIPASAISLYDDWTVQFYMNQISGDGTKHFVIFYPGNDPEATETIVETV